MKLKTGLRVITQEVDPETGEVYSSKIKTHKYIVKDKSQFYITYASMWKIFKEKELSRKSIQMYAYLVEKYKESVEFAFSKKIKDNLVKEIDIALPTIYKSLNELIESELITKTGRATYCVNPQHTWYGSSKKRESKLKYLFEMEYIETDDNNENE